MVMSDLMIIRHRLNMFWAVVEDIGLPGGSAFAIHPLVLMTDMTNMTALLVPGLVLFGALLVVCSWIDAGL